MDDHQDWALAHQAAVLAEERLLQATLQLRPGDDKAALAPLAAEAQRLRRKASDELRLLVDCSETKVREIRHSLGAFDLAVKIARRRLEDAQSRP